MDISLALSDYRIVQGIEQSSQSKIGVFNNHENS